MSHLWTDDRFQRFKYFLHKSEKDMHPHGSSKFFYKIESETTKEVAYTTDSAIALIIGRGTDFVNNPKNYNPTLVYRSYIVERLKVEEENSNLKGKPSSLEERVRHLESQLKEAQDVIHDLKQAHVRAANIMERILNIIEK